MRVLVTGSSTIFGTRLIQGLAEWGVQVTAADGAWFSPGRATRAAARGVRLPRIDRDPQAWFAALKRELQSRHYDLLLPTFEEALLLADHRDELQMLTQVFLPDGDTLFSLHDKRRLHAVCRRFEIPTPETLIPGGPLEAADVAAWSGPAVVKLPTSNNSVGRVYCDTPLELHAEFNRQWQQQELAGRETPFIQRRIEGRLVYTLMFCHEGRKLGEVIYRPLRTLPDDGGTSVYRESIAHAEIAELTQRLAAGTRWSGFLGLDFIVEDSTGRPHLIDANPRANPAVSLGYRAGVDWSALIVSLAQGRRLPAQAAQPGVRTRTLLLDIAWLLDAFRPAPGFWGRVADRTRRFLRPGWSVAAHSDLAASDWRCTLSLGLQSVSSLALAISGRQSFGEAMLAGASYNPVIGTREVELPDLLPAGGGSGALAPQLVEAEHPQPYAA